MPPAPPRAPALTARYQRIARLAEVYAAAPVDKRQDVALAYLYELAETLALEHDSEAIVWPLLDIIPYLADSTESPFFKERRGLTSVPSDAVLGRAAFAIDVWQTMGHTAEQAAQAVARQMINARAGLPAEGGDVRGWKRLLIWRERLVALKRPPEGWKSYQAATHEAEAMDRTEVVRRAQDATLWDVRARQKKG